MLKNWQYLQRCSKKEKNHFQLTNPINYKKKKKEKKRQRIPDNFCPIRERTNVPE